MDTKERERLMREKRLREPSPDEQGRPTSEAGPPPPRKQQQERTGAKAVIRD